jgi:ATP-binding cassette, subfamily B, bacterial
LSSCCHNTSYLVFWQKPAAHSLADGRITLLVSHRFSTVRMADLSVVLDGARLVELGPHDELVSRRGQYAELYGILAAAYR